MKRILILILGCVTAGVFAACGSGVVSGTNLSGLSIDGIEIGMPMEEISLDRYQNTGKYTGEQAYLFDEIILDEKDGKVSYLFGKFDEGLVRISVNGNTACTVIDDISALLGGNYREKTYDKEQHLMERVYYDFDRNVTAEFVYSVYDGSLLWMIVSAD